MEERPELWNPELWRKNNAAFPLKDAYDMEDIVRRSRGGSDITKEAEESRIQAEV
jgi:hypothetical protein